MERRSSTGRASRPIPLLLVGLVALAGAWPGASAAPRPPVAATRSLRAHLHEDSLRFAAGITKSRFDSLDVSLLRDLADARRQHDTDAVGRLLTMEGAGCALTGDARRAAATLDEALPIAAAERDTAWMLTALRWRAYAAGILGRLDEQERLAQRLVSLADASGNARFDAIGCNFLGWVARQRGDLRRARQYLERAVEGHRALHHEADEAFARTAYGATLMDLGDFGAARRSYARQLEIARRLSQGFTEAQAYNDLGVLEMLAGDPRLAVEYTRRAYEAFRARGPETFDAIGALSNLSDRELEVGHAAVAADLAREGLAIAERRGFMSLRGSLLNLLASAEEQLGHVDAARRACERALALGDSIRADASAWAVLGLSRALIASGRSTEGIAVVEASAPALFPKLPKGDRVRYEDGWAQRLFDAGRYPEALAVAQRAVEEARGLPADDAGFSAWGEEAMSRWKLGQEAVASAAFDSARAVWQRRIERSHDFEWRASLWSTPGVLCEHNVEFLLASPQASAAPDRVAAAYDRLQVYRTRGLLECVSYASPAAAPPRPWTCRQTQHELLRDGELLLEWQWGATVHLFAITRGERQVFDLGDAEALYRKIETGRGAVAQPPHGPDDVAAAEAVAGSLARAVFGPALSRLAKARSLLLVPDGPLHRVPFAALIAEAVPGSSRDVAVIPSVTLLGESRRHPPDGSSRGLLAIAPATPNDRPLHGAVGEVAWLSDAFEGVSRRSGESLDPEALAPTLSKWEAIHFAGHASLDDRFPWRSGIDVGAAPAADVVAAATGAPPARELLRAETIVATPLRARLVVLASCETAGGAVVAGEGVASLSTAFLAAGARSVVAALWPVDDRATATLMRAFYGALAGGKNAASALRIAQDRVRRGRGTRHPYYWAGFTLVGDGQTLLRLTPTPVWKRVLEGKALGSLTPREDRATGRNETDLVIPAGADGLDP